MNITLFSNIKPMTCSFEIHEQKKKHLKEINRLLNSLDVSFSMESFDIQCLSEEQLYLELWDLCNIGCGMSSNDELIKEQLKNLWKHKLLEYINS